MRLMVSWTFRPDVASRSPVGQGTADFPSLIGQLEDIPYRGPFVVGRPQMNEETATAELAQSVSYLRNL